MCVCVVNLRDLLSFAVCLTQARAHSKVHDRPCLEVHGTLRVTGAHDVQHLAAQKASDLPLLTHCHGSQGSECQLQPNKDGSCKHSRA